MRHLSGGLDHLQQQQRAYSGRHASGDPQHLLLAASSAAELPGGGPAYRAAGRHASGDSHLQVRPEKNQK